MMRGIWIVCLGLGCSQGKTSQPQAGPGKSPSYGSLASGSASIGHRVERVARWNLGGALVRRTNRDYWLRFDAGCGLAELSLADGLKVVDPPATGRCQSVAIAGPETLVFRTEVADAPGEHEWIIADKAARERYRRRGGRMLKAGPVLLHHQFEADKQTEGSLSAMTTDGRARWTIPVHPVVDNRSFPGMLPQVPGASRRQQLRTPRSAPHPSRPHWQTTFTVVEKQRDTTDFTALTVDVASGRLESKFTVSQGGAPPRLADFDSRTFVFVEPDNTVRIHGEMDFPCEFSANARVESVQIAPHFVFVDSLPKANEHVVYALQRKTCEVIWQKTLSGQKIQLFPHDQQVTWARDNVVAGVDGATGEELWQWSLPGVPRSVLRTDAHDWLASGLSFGTEHFRVFPSRESSSVVLRGRARVEGFASHEGIEVTANSKWSTLTRDDGTFELEVPARGTLVLWISAPNDRRMTSIREKARAKGAWNIATPPIEQRVDTEQPTGGLDFTLVPRPVIAPD
jgi:hypothetical protein